MNSAVPLAVFLAQSVPPQALVLAMLLSYALGFAGMLLAYLNYRKRRGRDASREKDKRAP